MLRSIIRLSIIFLFLHTAFAVSAQHYQPTDQGSKIHFTIKNFGINTGGDLSGLKGTINFSPSKLKTCAFSVSVDVKTIDTDNGNRDEHLRSNDYFDAEKFPQITIRSTKINHTNKSKTGWYYFTGTLTMHGVTKNIEFPFTATAQGQDYLFKGDFELNRKDYGVGGNSGVMGNTVKISLSVLGKKG